MATSADRNALREDDVRSVFALADGRPVGDRLLEREPRVPLKSLSRGSIPEDRDVDAMVSAAGHCVRGHDPDSISRLPRLDPRGSALLQFADNSLVTVW